MLVNLVEILKMAEKQGTAVGAFNTPNLENLNAVIEAAERLKESGMRCRLETLHEDRAFHMFGNGGMGTRMCVLVPPSEYARAKEVVVMRENGQKV